MSFHSSRPYDCFVCTGGLTAFLNLCEATSFTDGLFFRPSFTVSLSSSRSAAARIARRIDDSRIEARASASGQELCKLDQLFSPYLIYDKMTLSAQFRATHGDAKDFAPANAPGMKLCIFPFILFSLVSSSDVS
jgi:hypothetical protein